MSTSDESLRNRLRAEADASLPAFDAALHARTMARLKDAAAESLPEARRLRLSTALLAAAACVAIGLIAWQMWPAKSTPTVAQYRPPANVSSADIAQLLEPIRAPRFDAVPALLNAPGDHYQALGDDAQRVGRFMIDQLELLDSAFPRTSKPG
ncbi:MAG: hypothetical protein QM770_17790 [Tepidisphaeraceae bacterium]